MAICGDFRHIGKLSRSSGSAFCRAAPKGIPITLGATLGSPGAATR